jgi:hypothetical protein
MDDARNPALGRKPLWQGLVAYGAFPWFVFATTNSFVRYGWHLPDKKFVVVQLCVLPLCSLFGYFWEAVIWKSRFS